MRCGISAMGNYLPTYVTERSLGQIPISGGLTPTENSAETATEILTVTKEERRKITSRLSKVENTVEDNLLESDPK
jgi:hypothetical protein